MLELAVLGALKEKPMSGYELRKELAQNLGHAKTYSYSSLNSTLRKLFKAGAVDKDTAPGGRRKDVYRITDTGEDLFMQLLDESGPHAAEDRDSFMLRLSLFRYTKPETRRRLLERRRGYLLDQLERITDSLKKMRERMDNYSLQLMRYSENETHQDIRWLDDMLEAERRAEAKAAGRAERRATRKTERASRSAPSRTPARPRAQKRVVPTLNTDQYDQAATPTVAQQGS